MSDWPANLTYQWVPEPEPMLKEGVTPGWFVLWNGEPGPAKIKKVTALTDHEGVVVIEDDGEWEDTTVVDTKP